jgi:hypothetical protein
MTKSIKLFLKNGQYHIQMRSSFMHVGYKFEYGIHIIPLPYFDSHSRQDVIEEVERMYRCPVLWCEVGL